MNEKEARKRVEECYGVCCDCDNDQAIGYLEALEKAKVLEARLQTILNEYYGGESIDIGELEQDLATWRMKK